MKPEDTGLTFEDIKEKVDKYMIETYERMDFLAESAKEQYIYNENNSPAGSMQKKYMVRAILPRNSDKNLQIWMSKVFYREILRSRTPEILKNGVSEAIFSV